MSTILYNMINTRAEQSCKTKNITAANFHHWVRHWFKIAEIIQKEFECEGLTETANAVGSIIFEQKKYCSKYFEK